MCKNRRRKGYEKKYFKQTEKSLGRNNDFYYDGYCYAKKI